jgi:hypothetical protein
MSSGASRVGAVGRLEPCHVEAAAIKDLISPLAAEGLPESRVTSVRGPSTPCRTDASVHQRTNGRQASVYVAMMREASTSRIRPAWRLTTIVSAVATATMLLFCGDIAKLTLADGTGPRPTLPAPSTSAIPTLHIAPAKGWPRTAQPTPASGLPVEAFARGLDHPRWLYVLPNGDVLVAETNVTPKPDDAKGIKGWVMGRAMNRAGAVSSSADRITLLRHGGGDRSDWRRTAANLRSIPALFPGRGIHQLSQMYKQVPCHADHRDETSDAEQSGCGRKENLDCFHNFLSTQFRCT